MVSYVLRETEHEPSGVLQAKDLEEATKKAVRYLEEKKRISAEMRFPGLIDAEDNRLFKVTAVVDIDAA